MKIVDHIGNEIKKGRLLRWQHNVEQAGPLDFYVKVIDTVAPTKLTPGSVSFAVTIGIAQQTREDGAIKFQDFITVQDPEEELRADAALAKGAS